MAATGHPIQTHDLSHLQQWIERHSDVDTHIQYRRLIRTLVPYHEQNFAMYEDQYRYLVGRKQRVFQPSWGQFMGAAAMGKLGTLTGLQPPVSSANASKGSERTRAYKTRNVVPGFCNHEKTGEQLMNIKVPKTPPAEYTRPNINKDDRLFLKTQQTLRIYEYSQSEWMDLARKYINKINVLQLNFQPLTTYCQFILKSKTDRTLVAPCIFSAKMTSEQKAELLDAFYWTEMRQDKQYVGVINYYKLLGWFVRTKDGYRMTKHAMERQSFLTRSHLIQSGTTVLGLQWKPPSDQRREKSARGRKRKQNVTL